MKRFIALVVRTMMFFLLIEFFIVLWVGNFHLVYFLALISLLGFLFLLYSCGIFLYWFSWWFSVVILCFLFLDLRGANFIDCVPLWIGFCTSVLFLFKEGKKHFRNLNVFLNWVVAEWGGMGREEFSRCILFLLANDSIWALKSDCLSRKGWPVEGCWGICILGGILQVEASAGCSFAWNRFVVYFMLIFLLFLTNVFRFC